MGAGPALALRPGQRAVGMPLPGTLDPSLSAPAALRRSCFHASYRFWRFLSSPSATTLQQLWHHEQAPSAATFSEAQAATICEGTFAASQVVLAFGWPALLTMQWEWRDRHLLLRSAQVRAGAVRCVGEHSCRWHVHAHAWCTAAQLGAGPPPVHPLAGAALQGLLQLPLPASGPLPQQLAAVTCRCCRPR